MMSKRDLSAVGDVVREAKLLAEQSGAAKPAFEHIKRAIHEVLLVSDVPWAEMEKALNEEQNKSKGKRSAQSTVVVAPQESTESWAGEISPRQGQRQDNSIAARSRQSAPALECVPC